eukprot:PhM_4_TR12920/c0_g1_i1/m.2480
MGALYSKNNVRKPLAPTEEVFTAQHKSTTSRTEYSRETYRFGYHPTATRALILLGISTDMLGTEHEYCLCLLNAEEVLSFCIDEKQVLIVDITDGDANFSRSTACTCLVVE